MFYLKKIRELGALFPSSNLTRAITQVGRYSAIVSRYKFSIKINEILLSVSKEQFLLNN